MRASGTGPQTPAGHGQDDRLPSGDGHGGDRARGVIRVDDARSLVRDLFRREADVLPDRGSGELRVSVHASSNPRLNRALGHLLEHLNATEQKYPGTMLKLTYSLAGAAPIPKPGPEHFPGDQEV